MEKDALRVGQKFSANDRALFVNFNSWYGEVRIQDDPDGGRARCLDHIAQEAGDVDCSGCVVSRQLDTETPIEITNLLDPKSKVVLVSCRLIKEDGTFKDCRAGILLELLDRGFSPA